MVAENLDIILVNPSSLIFVIFRRKLEMALKSCVCIALYNSSKPSQGRFGLVRLITQLKEKFEFQKEDVKTNSPRMIIGWVLIFIPSFKILQF